MQHLRIGKYDMAFFAYGFARVAGRVPVVGKDTKFIVEPLIQIIASDCNPRGRLPVV